MIYGPGNFPADVNPLTGLKVSNPAILDRRPVLVKVSNFPRDGRPHAGLSQADMVFEYYIGEGTNRFLALYYGQDSDKVGPMRSARLADYPLVRDFQGILGYVSADVNAVLPVIISQLGKRAILYAPATFPAIYDDGKQTVTSVFADTAKMTDYAAEKLGIIKKRYPLDGLYFNSTPPNSDHWAVNVTVQYNPVNIGEWRYDPPSGSYLRWIESVDSSNKVTMIPLIDRINNKQLAFANVILLFAYYTEYSPTLHEINLWYNQNGQRAVIFRDGLAIEGKWKSNGPDAPMQFFLPDGSLLPLKPGNTWMVITGLNTKINQPSQGNWLMNFFLP